MNMFELSQTRLEPSGWLVPTYTIEANFPVEGWQVIGVAYSIDDCLSQMREWKQHLGSHVLDIQGKRPKEGMRNCWEIIK